MIRLPLTKGTAILNLTPGYVAKLYRARWNIEIFFKTIKQNLRIKKFYGQTENAVKSQIWIALTVYLLYLKLCKMSGSARTTRNRQYSGHCFGKRMHCKRAAESVLEQIELFKKSILARAFRGEL